MRVLIAGFAQRWVGVARLPGALKAAGFEVGVLARTGSALGSRTPRQAIAPSLAAAEAFAEAEGFPVILKPDLTQAGRGVRICRSREELAAAIGEYRPAKTVFSVEGSFAIQRFIRGSSLAVTFAALRGEMLASHQLENVRSRVPETGPASVVRRIDGDSFAAALRPL